VIIMRISGLDILAASVAIVTLAGPAVAAVPTPAPIAGIGIGAFVALGVGYRALKRRIGR
jgi:hypothetical protein